MQKHFTKLLTCSLIVVSLYGCSASKTVFSDNLTISDLNKVQNKFESEYSKRRKQKKENVSQKEQKNTIKKQAKKTSEKSPKNQQTSIERNRYDVEVVSSIENQEEQVVYNIKNNGLRAVSVDVKIHFYDEKGKEIKTATDTIQCLDKGESLISFFQKNEVPESFNDYKIKLSLNEVSVISMKKNMIYSQSEDNNQVSIAGRNSANNAISTATFNIIYMMDETPVYCETLDSSDIQSGHDFSLKADAPKDSNGNDIEYNNYQIFLKDAFGY